MRRSALRLPPLGWWIVLSALGLLLVLGGKAQAQEDLSPTINLFGDDIVRKLQGNGRVVRFFGPNGPFEQAIGKAPDGYEHTLTFQDGSQIRGSLVALNKTEIQWKRPDADAVLSFPREQVRRLTLRKPPQSPRQGWVQIPGLELPGTPDDARPLATVKLPGGDWLHGEVLSGQSNLLSVRLNDDTEFTVDRSFVHWLHLGSKPVPAFGFAGGALDFESWNAMGAGNRLQVQNGVAVLPDNGWFGRAMTAMQRFEVSFEISRDTEENTVVWLQPLGPQVNCYTTGTVVLRLSSKEFRHSIYANQMQDVRTPVPQDDSPEAATVRYRIRFNGSDQKLTVFRNGRQLGEWDFIEGKEREQARMQHQFMVNGICFQRERGASDVLKLHGLRVLPWLGTLSESPVGQGDCVLSTDTASLVGTLGALGRTDFYFSGKKQARKKDTLLQFATNPVPLSVADAVLTFGDQGELSVGDLEVTAGKLLCRSVFSPSLKLPLGALQAISFPSKSVGPAGQPTDRLIFNNSDEIYGKLLSATDNGIIRWRMFSGQETTFGREAIAGIRLAPRREQPAVDAATQPVSELRNGDLIRGTVTASDDGHLKIRTAAVGELTVSRDKVNILLPNTGMSGVDGGYRPDLWIKGTQEVQPRGRQSPKEPEQSWVYLDGSYILRPQGVAMGGAESPSLYPPLPQPLERFELRCDVTDPSGNDPSFAISLQEKKASTGLQASFNYGRLQLYVNSRQARGAANFRHIMLDSKIKEPTSRRRVRIFVDSKIGTSSIYLDGVLLVHTGQQANERLPGMGETIRIYGYGQSDAPLIFSNLWVGPWNGELPAAGSTADAGVALTNGDFAAGAPGEFVGGKVKLESEIGPLELPVEKVLSVCFGGAIEPAKAAARLRFVDGTSIHVDSFSCGDGKIAAKSALLGELNFESAALAEIVMQPSPVRPPQNVIAKKEAETPQDDQQAEP